MTTAVPASEVDVIEIVESPIGVMELYRSRGHIAIAINGEELMCSANHESEDELGRMAGRLLTHLATPRLLIGGLGLGYSLRAALDALPQAALVDIAELVTDVVRWNRTILGPLADHPLDDPRVTLIEDDVARVIGRAEGCYDAIVLDVDNGPDALTDSNAELYLQPGLATIRRALTPTGVLAIWSAFDSLYFTRELQIAGFDVDVHTIRTWRAGGATHTIWVARPSTGAAAE